MMRKLLLGVGALLMASAVVPASAHEWNSNTGYGNGYNSGYNNSYRYNSGSGYVDVVRQHVRLCRQHDRLHERLAQRGDQFYDQGFGYGSDQGYARDGRGDAHDAYHDRVGDVRNCDYWYAQYNNLKRYRDHDRYDRYSW